MRAHRSLPPSCADSRFPYTSARGGATYGRHAGRQSVRTCYTTPQGRHRNLVSQTSSSPAPEPNPPEGRPAGGGAEHTLPASYGSDRIVLMARDPYWAFAYWELTEGGRRAAQERLGTPAEAVIRLFELTGTGERLPRTDVPAGPASSWYFNVSPGKRYQAALGLRLGNAFEVIAESQAVLAPPDGPSERVDASWMVLYDLYGPEVSFAHASSPGGLRTAARRADWFGGSEAWHRTIEPLGTQERRSADLILTLEGRLPPGLRLWVGDQAVEATPSGEVRVRLTLPEGGSLVPVRVESAAARRESPFESPARLNSEFS